MFQRLAFAILLSFSTALQARDLGLAEAERLLLQRNRDLIAARRALEAAGAQREIAAARPNATLSLNASSVGRSVGPGPLDQKRIDTVLRVDQPFERGGKRELRMDAAEGLERAARDDSLDALRTQLQQLRAAYYDLKQAEGKVEILDGTAALFGRTLAAAEARRRAGDLAAADVARVQVDQERAQNEARAAQAELAHARLALGFMIGEESGATALRASDPWPALSRPEADAVEREVARYVEARPDVAAARARLAAAEKLRDLAKSQRTRDITVGAQYERYPGTVPADSIGVGIALPLFTGYDYSGDIRRAEVDRYAALDALDRARAAAGADIRRAASDLAAAADRLGRYETSLLGAAQRSADAAGFAFERGASSVLDVLDARRTLGAVRLEALAARADYARALAAWEASRAAGDALQAREGQGGSR